MILLDDVHAPPCRNKLLSRIQSVPDDRWLIETDQNTPAAIDTAMMEILEVVGEAKGWDLERTAQQAASNFELFCNVHSRSCNA
jgi:TatD DNase family protein